MAELHIDSTLGALRLHCFGVDWQSPGQVVYQQFEADPSLPGVLLYQGQDLKGIISRRHFLEAMSRAYGRELFLRRPLAVLYEFVQTTWLALPADTGITQAAQLAVDRPAPLLYEPIVVTGEQTCGLVDVQDLLQAQAQIYQLTNRLLQEKTRKERMQTEKMASLGKMMAGVAHEIRNPVNFIWGNLKYVSEYSQDLAGLVRALEAEVTAPSPQLKKLRRRVDVDFVLEDLARVVQSIETGTDRLRNLVTSLRTFSRMDEVKRSPTDLHQSLDSTLLILNNRIKEGIRVEKQYGELPTVVCYSGQIGQVFMNLISNAIDALLESEAAQAPVEDSRGRDWEPCLTLITGLRNRWPADAPKPAAQSGPWVSVRIQDNGPGIPPEIQQRIFEDFFTTKPAGQGTGLGLPISLQIVVEKHQGQMILRSPCPGSAPPLKGTEFEVLLPLIPVGEAEPRPLAPTPTLTEPPTPGQPPRQAQWSWPPSPALNSRLLTH